MRTAPGPDDSEYKTKEVCLPWQSRKLRKRNYIRQPASCFSLPPFSFSYPIYFGKEMMWLVLGFVTFINGILFTIALSKKKNDRTRSSWRQYMTKRSSLFAPLLYFMEGLDRLGLRLLHIDRSNDLAYSSPLHGC